MEIGGGNDTLDGGGGKDTLTGGLGSDSLRFSSTPNSSTDRDRITDFNVVDDRIQLENAVFTALPTTGTLAARAFISGSSFTTTAQRIRYESTTGNLFYDPDGNGGHFNPLCHPQHWACHQQHPFRRDLNPGAQTHWRSPVNP